jgi:hypothetical protein
MRAAPNPRTLTGRFGASPDVLRFPLRAFRPPARFLPFARRPVVSPRAASSGLFPSAVPAWFRFPFGFPPVPFPFGNLHVSAAARRFRRRWSRAAGTNVTSSTVTPRRYRAIPARTTDAAAGHDGMSPHKRLICAAEHGRVALAGSHAERRLTARLGA